MLPVWQLLEQPVLAKATAHTQAFLAHWVSWTPAAQSSWVQPPFHSQGLWGSGGWAQASAAHQDQNPALQPFFQLSIPPGGSRLWTQRGKGADLSYSQLWQSLGEVTAAGRLLTSPDLPGGLGSLGSSVWPCKDRCSLHLLARGNPHCQSSPDTLSF